jgi:hypothetical protein
MKQGQLLMKLCPPARALRRLARRDPDIVGSMPTLPDLDLVRIQHY